MAATTQPPHTASPLHDAVTAIGRNERLEAVAKPISNMVHKLVPHGRLKDLLSGSWLGHPLHPVLTDVVIGSLTSASILDLIGGRRAQPAANALAAVGLATVLPTAAAGASDWSDTYGPERRIGVVHAAANLVGAGFYAASVIARRRGNRLSATAFGLTGMGVMSIGGYLGGHLTFFRGVGVNHTFLESPSGDWAVAIADDELPETTPKVVDRDGIPTLLYRTETAVAAISNRCTHAGGPLNEGEFADDDRGRTCVTCPWHASTFHLDDGSVVHGPATAPQPAYESRVSGGKIELRAR